MKSNCYTKDVSHLKVIDIYMILHMYEVCDHAVGHAVKKLLCAGKRGAKSRSQDIREAIASLERALEMDSLLTHQDNFSFSIKS